MFTGENLIAYPLFLCDVQMAVFCTFCKRSGIIILLREDEGRVIRKNQRFLNFLNITSDAFLLFASYSLAMFVRVDVLGGDVRLPLTSWPYQLMAAGCALAVVFVYYILKMYSSYRLKSAPGEVLKVMLVNGIAALAVMAFFYISRITEFPRLAVFLFWLFSSLLVITKRTVCWAILRHYRSLGYNQKHVAVVGNGHLAKQYIMDILANPHQGITIDGYISGVEKPELGRCLGRYEDLESILDRYELDELVVALEPHETQFMKPVLAAADKEGIRLGLIPFYNDYIPPHPTIDVIGKSRLIDMRSTPLDSLGWSMVKRSMDVVGSLVLIILLSPVMLFAAIGVRLSSPGPILFRQERVGKGKKPFTMYKFRSMAVSDSAQTGWSTASDPRKTRFGSFIRKFSIDELPQFFNVLFGDMSLVGPRPEIPYHVRHFKEEVPLYLVRQQVRPGITGWAQVNGLRGDTSIEDRVVYDIWYIENWSLMLDIKILLKTVFGGMINNEKLKN